MSDRNIGCLLSGGLDSSLICGIVASYFNNKKNLKTFSVGLKGSVDLNSFKKVSKYENFVDRLLFDAKLTKEKLNGGITETLNWKLLNSYKGNKDWLLAGGLNHNNVKEALNISNAEKIDVSSGVEIAPGIKCELLIKT